MVKGNNGKGNCIERDEWETPQKLFDILDSQYLFNFDCCANELNTKCDVWSEQDFLDYDDVFNDDIHWMNPPFSKALQMFKHFFKITKQGVAIYRCDNMETSIWQDVILKNADWLFLMKDRINYEGMKGNRTRFSSALIGIGVNPPTGIEGTTLIIKKGTPKC